MRRRFSVVALLLALCMSLPAVSAQEATPSGASPFADLGLPTLDITVTGTGYEGIPESLEAGRYLVTVTASEDTGEFGGGVTFLQPAGMTGDEFITMLGELSGPPDESGVGAAAATPIEGGAASPEADGGEAGGVPPFLFESVMAGGAYAGTGESSQVILDLTPGEWVAWADDPAAPQEPVVFEATGEMPADLVEPESQATLTMGEYVIKVTEGELTAGAQVVRVDNIGAQPHFIGWVQGPDGLTEAQVQTVLDEEMQAEMTGTPPAYSDLNPDEDFTEVTFTGTQSTGTSQWVLVDEVEAGTHLLICFFPDMADGVPHAFHGMYTILEIAE
jgi:hypothetical protein